MLTESFEVIGGLCVARVALFLPASGLVKALSLSSLYVSTLISLFNSFGALDFCVVEVRGDERAKG